MSAELVIQQFENVKLGVRVRVVNRDGEPWFVAKDVAAALGYERPRKAVMDHCKGGSKMGLPSNGGIQEMIIIPESDLYRLILRSKLPQAEAFQDWVVGEVLPSIRKHGMYATPTTIENMLVDPRHYAELFSRLADERDRRALLEEREALFGNRTPYGLPSKANGEPRTEPVHGYLRVKRITKTTIITEHQLRLFEWD